MSHSDSEGSFSENDQEKKYPVDLKKVEDACNKFVKNGKEYRYKNHNNKNGKYLLILEVLPKRKSYCQELRIVGILDMLTCISVKWVTIDQVNRFYSRTNKVQKHWIGDKLLIEEPKVLLH
jgi:hypothetical protein